MRPVIIILMLSSCASAEKGGVIECARDRARQIMVCTDEHGNVVEIPTAKPKRRSWD